MVRRCHRIEQLSGRFRQLTLAGHLWTLGGYLRRTLRPPRVPVSRRWTTTLVDPDRGSIRLTGALSEPTGAEALVVVVHGLGGCCDSAYVVEAAARLVESGFACLRLSLRGADRTGEDIYHAGLAADLAAAFASPEVGAYERTAVLGFSLGGHVALRFALDEPASGLRTVVAICPPVDLAAVATRIDSTSRWIYRRYLLGRLFEIYSEVARRRQLARSIGEVRQTRTFVEFDSMVIAPRYGFVDAWDYYQTVSVGPHLAKLEIPTLLVAAEEDPMVPAASLENHLPRSNSFLLCRRSRRGGHLSFPGDLDLGQVAEPGLYPQMLAWFRSQLEV